ncbi:MAG: hydantoinase/oxoprolinase family protein [Proteobacteria bacterium]|nr:hydantoinase/oxoprolinase family protein [Pseudomonadota bacterium]
MLRIGIDVGGTFTDLVAVDEGGRVTLAKTASTPADQSVGAMDGLARLAGVLGTDLRGLLRETERIVHGTTVATNALLERKGARVGLLTTEGHRDVIEMREGLKDERYNLRMPPPVPLAPRSRRFGVRERVRADGRISTPINQRSLAAAIKQLKAEDVESVAVCYLHAYRDPRHERTTRKALKQALPKAYIALSSEVHPQIKEYERVCTTVVNAYVGPALARYLGQLERRLAEAGYAGPVLIMQSHGGVAPIAESIRLAAGAVLSGPAGGVAGSAYSARLLGEGNFIPFDMGGTSTDISLIVDGQPSLSSDRAIAGQRVALRSLDIVSIGAGGGSIGWVDGGGVLHVGPQSAGAEPGPACYGKGGSAAAVTDANLVLGYLDPGNFLGGRTKLDRAAAEKAVGVLARQLKVEPIAAAEGIHRVVNTRMAEGIRLVSVRRGVDPRRFALLSFGGAAGLHVTDVARQLELRRVVVPRVAAVLSAWGMLATDLRYEVARTHIGDVQKLNAKSLAALFKEMEEEGRGRLGQSFSGPVRIHRSADMRYGEQIFEIGVSLDGVDWNGPDPMGQVVESFHRRHEELYTYALPDQEVVLVNARVAVVGTLPALPDEPPLGPRRPGTARTRRLVYLGGWHEVPVYDLETLAAGQAIEGPAIIETATTTALLRPSDRARITERGWIDIAVGGAA